MSNVVKYIKFTTKYKIVFVQFVTNYKTYFSVLKNIKDDKVQKVCTKYVKSTKKLTFRKSLIII